MIFLGLKEGRKKEKEKKWSITENAFFFGFYLGKAHLAHGKEYAVGFTFFYYKPLDFDFFVF